MEKIKKIRIKKITVVSNEDVYDISVKDNHNFFANGVLVHNCAEEPLPNYGACLLGSMNLSAYVKEGEFDYVEFDKDVRIATKALNEVQVEGGKQHPLLGQCKCAEKYKQIGLGIFDLAGALIKMGVRYGSEDSFDLANKITLRMLISAFEQSCDLNKGRFFGLVGKRKYDGMFESEFYKTRIKPYISKKYIGKYPLNSQLLTIAPTGTISTMVNASSGGGEPVFALKYNRTTKTLNGKDTDYVVYPQIVLDYFEKSDINEEEFASLPDYFVSSADIPWKERIEMQSALQKNIDASISSTINLPESATVEDVYGIYMYAWKCGLKGVTVFRENCKRIAILSVKPASEKQEFPITEAPKRPKTLDADFYQVKANGKSFQIIVGLYAGRPYELFAIPCEECKEKIPNHRGTITKMKKQVYSFDSELIHIPNIAISNVEKHDIIGEINKISNLVNENAKLTKEDVEAIKESVYNVKHWSENNDREYRNVALHVSGALRHGMPVKSIISLEGKCNDLIISFNSAVSRILAKYTPKEITEETCPDCGASLIREGGCIHCSECSWSRCE